MGANAAELSRERRYGVDRPLYLEVPGTVPKGIPGGSDFEDLHTSHVFSASNVLGGHLGIKGNVHVDSARPDTLKALIDATIKYGVYA
jgi:hypothetical protein